MNSGVLITSTRQMRQAMSARAAFSGTVSAASPNTALRLVTSSAPWRRGRTYETPSGVSVTARR